MRKPFFLGLGAVAVFLVIPFLSGCASAPSVTPAARSELAPTGKLRVGLLAGNSTYVSQDGPADQMQGLAVDLARELARQLGVPFEPVRFNSPGEMLKSLQSWDVAFLGFDPARAAQMDYTGPYARIENTFIVRTDSKIRTVADADKKGNRIGASARSVQDAFLSRNFKQAEVVRFATPAEAIKLVGEGKIDAYTGPRLSHTRLAAKDPKFRVADGTLFNIEQALAVAKGRPAGTAYARAFIEHAKSSGLVQQSIERHSMIGINVAPAVSAASY